MIRLRWKPGPEATWRGPAYVSTTRFTYRSGWRFALVAWHGLALRRGWSRVPGAVGLSIMSDARTRTTYTLSVWRSEVDLKAWVRTPSHARLMAEFRPALASSAAAGWVEDAFSLKAAWRLAMARVAPQAESAGQIPAYHS